MYARACTAALSLLLLATDAWAGHAPVAAGQNEQAWLLGIRLSDAVAKAGSASAVRAKLDDAAAVAGPLGLRLPPGPVMTGNAGKDARALMTYGGTTVRDALAKSVEPGQNPRPVALFSVAFKAGTLTAIYEPNSSESQAIAKFV